jgi:hypothetical protein
MAYIGKQPVVGNFVKLDAITTSATATYNLLNGGVAYFPQTANNCIVSLNGVIQSPTSAYTISGSTIVFSDALTSSDSIDFILVLGDVLSIGTPSDGTITSAKLASGTDGLFAWQSVQTTGFTAVAARAYPCNTTSSAFTVTLPASPSVGDQVLLLDYAGTWDTNALTINPNSNKIIGQTSSVVASKDREAITLTYIDSTQGWLPNSGYQESTGGLGLPYSIDFLVIAGGGGGGNGQSGGGGGAGGYRTSTQTVNGGTVITVTVGDGGAAATQGSSSSISGSGLTTITSAGGGAGGGNPGGNGGSGGGGQGDSPTTGGSGNTPSTSPSQGNNGGNGSNGPYGAGAGGGGAGAAGSNAPAASAPSTPGGNGGNGLASSITGSSVTRAGGGGGSSNNDSTGTGGTGGTGGGGNGASNGSASGSAGTANTGGGGGGAESTPGVGGTGGKGVVILSVPTANYSSTTTGSPTVTTSGSNTILQFNGSGTYTA